METGTHSEADEIAAVMKVIDAESRAFYNKDFETFSRCWVHAPYIRRLGWWTRGGVTDRRGWDEIGERARQQMLDNPEHNRTAEELRRENLTVRVMGDMAWASFDQHAPDAGEPDMDMPGLSRESRVLEKHGGEWRIAYHTYIHQTAEPMRSAMFRVDRDANLSWMNQPGEEIARKGDALKVVRGRLHAADDAGNRRLRAAIAAAAARDGTLDGGRAAIPVMVDAGVADEVRVCWVLTEGSGSGAVLVSLNNITFAQDQVEAAARAFRLSTSQQRLAELIVGGQDLTRSAAMLGVSVNTARTHLQRIFEKTGVHSQAALVRTLLSAAPPAA